MCAVSTSAVNNADELLESAVSGDRCAAERVWEMLRPDLVAFVAQHVEGVLQRRFDAEDVVQDVLAYTQGRLQAFAKWSFEDFRRWHLKICWRQLIRLRRRHLNAEGRSLRAELNAEERDVDVGEALAPATADASDNSSESEKSELDSLETAISHLQIEDREVIRLRYWENLRGNELGERLGVRPRTARKRAARAVLRLRRAITAAH